MDTAYNHLYADPPDNPSGQLRSLAAIAANKNGMIFLKSFGQIFGMVGPFINSQTHLEMIEFKLSKQLCQSL